ncbi:MAG: leucine-rich repeat protein [Firmicutes bacterium]|nr:leucine-rich repeat protein [Bacillota bacterium]
MKLIQKIGTLLMIFCLIAVTAPVTPAYADDEEDIYISDVDYELDPWEYTYTGQAITPEPTLTHDGVRLTKGTDYTLSYENNVNAGDALIHITGKGKYLGEREEGFYINPADLSEIGATLTLSQESFAYTGEEIKPAVTVKAYDKTLKQSTDDEEYDYYVDYWDNYDVGTATVNVSGTGNYCGELRKEFTITGTDISTIENLKVEMQEGPFTYTGEAIEPWVDSMWYEQGGERYYIEIDSDNISYKNNVNAGTATIEIPAAGNYSGKVTKTFTIKPRNFSEGGLHIDSEIYDDSFQATYKATAITPRVDAVYYDDYLVDPKSYKVEYADNVDAGDAKIIIIGTDSNNQGNAEFEFSIGPADLSDIGATVTLDPEISIYTPVGAEPAVIVKAFGKTLERALEDESGDYYLWFEENENIGEAKARISGTGNYTGEITKTFSIVPLDVNNITGLVFLLDEGPFTYNGSAIKPYVDKLCFLIGDEEYYVRYDEENVVYSNNVESGTGTVEVTGIENYTGKIQQTFTINPRDYTDSDRIWVEGKIYTETYTGEAYTPEVTAVYYDDVKVNPASYKIEYADNIDAGDAKIIVTGLDSNNVGTHVTTFRIELEVLDRYDVEMPYVRVLYTGSTIEADPTVIHNDKTLVRDKDYKVTYTGDTKGPGEIKVTVQGIGNYQGSYDYTYEIVRDGDKADEGTCGKDIKWTVYHKGIDYRMVIEGYGDMDYWTGSIGKYNGDIVEVEMSNGINYIRPGQFSGFYRLESITLPKELEQIGSSAFSGCEALKQIDIPEGVTSIPQSGFANCTALTKVTLPSTLVSIAPAAFKGCTAITSMDFPENLKAFGTEAFMGCSSLTSIDLPDSVESIGYDAFSFCPALKTAKLPAKLDCIAESMFESCENLESITMPNQLTDGIIYKSAFYGCSKLSSIVIPEGTTTIMTSAFTNCTSLKSVTLPATLKEIGSGAFVGCTAVTNVTYAGTPKGWALIKINSGNESIENAERQCLGVDVTGIGIATKSLALALGDSDYINAWVIPTNASGKTIKWTTSDEKVVTVNDGWIYAVGIGTAVITATTAEGGFSATCTVTVTEGGGQVYDLANCKVILSQDTFVYTGQPVAGPEITVMDGNTKLMDWQDYHAYWVGGVDVGTVGIEIEGLGKYEGTSTSASFKIIPKATSISKIAPLATGLKVTWKKVAGVTGYKVYRNNKLVKTVTSASTVNYSDKAAKTNGTKYTYKVVAYKTVNGVKYDSKASATKSYTFLTKPAFKSLKNSAAKAMTVKWSKNAKTTGYKIQYSLKSNFSNAKTVTIKKAGTLSKKITGLKKGKTYYVRIRCYKGSNYSVWSAVKKVKISK